MAVEDIARIRPTATADFQGKPTPICHQANDQRASQNLKPAQADDRLRASAIRARAQLEPDDEEHHHHAELGEMHHIAAHPDEAVCA